MNFTIVFAKKYNIEIDPSDKDWKPNDITTYITDKKGDLCLDFDVNKYNKNIYIGGIGKCLETSGTYILKSMKYIYFYIFPCFLK